MRILFVNDGVGDAGGVQRYLSVAARELARRGHDLALLHLDRLRRAEDSPVGSAAAHFCAHDAGVTAAMDAAVAWRPDVVFSHNMRELSVDANLVDRLPVVKMMHGYFGTCAGGQKWHAFPRRVACGRRYGAACAVLYLPRHCGRWSVGSLRRDYRWAGSQHALLARYAAIVVASAHMGREYARHGVPGDRIVVDPLFADVMPEEAAPNPTEFRAVFLGRMTSLKGGDVFLRAVSLATRQLGEPMHVTMAGDGPSRRAWEALAASLGVAAEFPGWVDGQARAKLFRSASVVAVPSIWPEPFGLTGLEAGAYGAAAIGFDVGGIGEWLHDGENGWLVGAREGAAGLARALADARAHDGTLRALRAGARRMAERFTAARHIDVLEQTLTAARAGGRRHG